MLIYLPIAELSVNTFVLFGMGAAVVGTWAADRWDLHSDKHVAVFGHTYDWLVIAEKGMLKTLSVVMKPIFAANHRWAMAQGEHSLRLELARRRAVSDAELAAIPPPQGPITYAGAMLVAAAGAAGVGIAYLVMKALGSHDHPVRRDCRNRRRRRE